jgi:hypothetical protein
MTVSSSAVDNVQTENVQGQPTAQYPIPGPPNRPSDSGHAIKSAAKSRPRPTELTEIDTRRPGRSKSIRSKRSSPARKKSKYSAFSVEVDKALTVLYSELETAAQCGKAEGHLESKVLDLEQKLKLQDGQLMLSNRELDFARSHLTKEQAKSGVLKKENVELRDEVAKLREMVQQKDGELRDWRTKLRTMMGSELE